MSEMKALLAWPEPVIYRYAPKGGISIQAPYNLYDVIAYEHARGEAALERLRAAVEAIVKMRDCETLNEELHIAYEALASIGDIP